MARIIMKSPYLKANGKSDKHAGNYARYIATREGAQLAEDTQKHLPATVNQEALVSQILKDFPDSTDLHEYADYKQNPTRGNASELIDRVLEAHSGELGGREKYVSYIAERPGVEKLGKHGLFTDEGVPIVLEQVVKEMAQSKSNIWTHIISLRREDAARLGYETAEDWMNLLRSKRNVIAREMGIKPENFQCTSWGRAVSQMRKKRSGGSGMLWKPSKRQKRMQEKKNICGTGSASAMPTGTVRSRTMRKRPNGLCRREITPSLPTPWAVYTFGDRAWNKAMNWLMPSFIWLLSKAMPMPNISWGECAGMGLERR